MGALSTVAAQPSASELPDRLGLLGDEQLARLVESGSERAFATIYARHHQRLYRYCYSVLRDSDDAYDALQSTLAGALAALQRGQRDAPLRPWLFRIAHNESVLLIRRRGPAWEASDAVEPCADSAEHQAGERARLALLVADLRQLTERQRSVLLMRELSGLSHREIAIALGISVHRVKHAMSAARCSLVEFEDGRVMACENVRRSISYEEERGLRRARVRAHLRDCTTCAAFAATIPTRRADLQALAPPLAPVLAAGLLARLHAAGSASSTAGAGGAAGGAAAGVAGKTVGATLVAKTLVGVAIVAAAAASMSGALTPARHDAPQPSAAQPAHTARAAGATRRRALVIGARSKRGHHGAAPAAVHDGRPASAISGAQSPSTLTAAPVAAGSPVASGGASAHDLGPAQDLGSPPRTGVGSQRDGRARGGRHPGARHPGARHGGPATGEQHRGGRGGSPRVAGYGGDSGGRPTAGSQHAGGPGARAGLAANAGGAGGNPSAGGNPGGSVGMPPAGAAGGGSGGPPASVTGPPASVTGPPSAPVTGPLSPSGAGGGGQPAHAQSAPTS